MDAATARRQARGYTIIELMVVMLVLAVLATLAFPIAEMQVRRDRERELKRSLWEIREAIDAYKRAYDAGRLPQASGASGYPASLQALVQGVRSSDTGQQAYFLRRIPRDPFADPALPAEQSWGLRSYDSGPEQPRPGVDVYDVYSLAPGAGLNGVPFREW